MRMIRLIATMLVSATALVATACGGGGGGGESGGVSAATLSGQVIAHNGASSNLGGLQFTLLSIGQTVTTASDGSFAFGSVPAGTIALSVADPTASTAMAALGEVDGREAGDDVDDDANGDRADDGDNNDVGDGDGDVSDVSDGEAVEVHVSVDHGVITRLEVARAHHRDDRECDQRLVRSDASDDLDATGHVKTRSSADGEVIRIRVEHFTPGRSLDAFIVQGGIDASLGLRTASDGGRAEWVVDTARGDALPHGATTIADLVGDLVEIRDSSSGLVLLHGIVTEPPPAVSDHNGDGHPDRGHHDGERLFGRALLHRADGVVGEAHVVAEHRADAAGCDRFEVEVAGQVAGRVIEVWLADGGGVLTNVGTFTIRADRFGEFERDTHDGGTLPFGVTSAADLVGRAIELRSSDGSVLFTGTVPALVSVH
jgi:hypothetical protein